MAGLVPAIHVLAKKKDVDARHKAGHDERNVALSLSERTSFILSRVLGVGGLVHQAVEFVFV